MAAEGPKEILRKARTAQRNIDRLQDEIRRLEEMRIFLSATDYSAVVVKHSASRGNVERMATDSRMEQLRKRLEREAERMAEYKLDAIALIGVLDDLGMQAVLWEYYIHAATNWDEAACRAGYSTRHAHRLHGQALEILRKSCH